MAFLQQASISSPGNHTGSDLPENPSVKVRHMADIRRVDRGPVAFQPHAWRPAHGPVASQALATGIVVQVLYWLAAAAFLAALSVASHHTPFPQMPAVWQLGASLGLLIASQSWFPNHRWRISVRLAVGLLLATVLAPWLPTNLGDPSQWWIALVLTQLTTLSVNSILRQSADGPPTRQAQPGHYGLPDVFAFLTLLGCVFQLGKLALSDPMSFLDSFAWFGGFAVLIAVLRFAWEQTLQVCSTLRDLSDRANRRQPAKTLVRQRRWAIWELTGLAGFLFVVNASVLPCLQAAGVETASAGAAFALLLLTETWQLGDLWIGRLTEAEAASDDTVDSRSTSNLPVSIS